MLMGLNLNAYWALKATSKDWLSYIHILITLLKEMTMRFPKQRQDTGTKLLVSMKGSQAIITTKVLKESLREEGLTTQFVILTP